MRFSSSLRRPRSQTPSWLPPMQMRAGAADPFTERGRRRGVAARMCLSDSSHLLFTYKRLIWRRRRSRERRCENKTQPDVVQRLLLPEGGAMLSSTEARHVTGTGGQRLVTNSDQYSDSVV